MSLPENILALFLLTAGVVDWLTAVLTALGFLRGVHVERSNQSSFYLKYKYYFINNNKYLFV